MPSIIGNIKIVSVSGVVNFGDSFYIAPKSTSKTFAGAGSFSTGDFQLSKQGITGQTNIDNDVADTTTAANA
ncbi:hypothetical protein BHF71_08200 [Vulcanibacillus modesticaldus]|uniref:Uncharacterized protein n=1 Tax=Vulcanibacillus modesticaldus TaxID=337097 RepID=A0A1D2YV62_9BACI|nr:spore germination protein [Vulcanibacillus modesticaldus]OEF99594.1 hypothetical protein BHF71_08200 [Vulcanibacillus modesticaldus]